MENLNLYWDGLYRKQCGKGEKAGYQYFLLYLQCSQKAFFPGSLKVWKGLNHNTKAQKCPGGSVASVSDA